MMKNKKIISPHSALRIPHLERGFTLVELAMVLVVLGLLIGLGASLIGPLTKQAKVVESREAVKNARAALMGFAVKSGYLPTTIGPSGARELDAWGRALSYAADTTLLLTSTNACNRTNTDRTIFECTDTACTAATAKTKNNIAFIVYSTGEDADGLGTTPFQPTAGPACASGTCYWIREQASSDASYTLQYDDIVQYATLDEIRNAMECSFAITNQRLPDAILGTVYNVTGVNLQASGGQTPYTSWAITTGALPAGLAITNTGAPNYYGRISGTPTAAGVSNFTVTVPDTNGVTTSKAFTLNVIGSSGTCLITGINIVNRTGAARYFNRNGICSGVAWATNTSLNTQAYGSGGIQQTDTYTFWTNAACTTACTGTASLTFTQAQTTDTNQNCQIQFNATGFTCNRADY